MKRADLPNDSNFFEIGYCGHPAFPYTHIQIEKVTKLIHSKFQEEDHTFIYDTLQKKRQNWFAYIFFTGVIKLHLDRI